MNDDELAEGLKALAAPARLKIVDLLREHERCVRALTLHLRMSQPSVSQHLAVLKHAGLVRAEKNGTMVHYRIQCDRLAAIVRELGLRTGTESHKETK